MGIESYNKTLNEFKPGKLLSNTAGIATIEGKLAIEQAGNAINGVLEKFANTATNSIIKIMDKAKDNKIIERLNDSELIKQAKDTIKQANYPELMNQAKDTIKQANYPELMNQTKETIKQANNSELMKKARESKHIHGISKYLPRQSGGGDEENIQMNNEDELMRYVYTGKPIWFTKKDMIWN
jgi:hypothetical protein